MLISKLGREGKGGGLFFKQNPPQVPVYLETVETPEPSALP